MPSQSQRKARCRSGAHGEESLVVWAGEEMPEPTGSTAPPRCVIFPPGSESLKVRCSLGCPDCLLGLPPTPAASDSDGVRRQVGRTWGDIDPTSEPSRWMAW